MNFNFNFNLYLELTKLKLFNSILTSHLIQQGNSKKLTISRIYVDIKKYVQQGVNMYTISKSTLCGI